MCLLHEAEDVAEEATSLGRTLKLASDGHSCMPALNALNAKG